MKKSVSIYLKDDVLRIVAAGRTDQGHTVLEPLVFFLKVTASPQEIGSTVLNALSQFKIDIPHPKDEEAWKLETKIFFKALRIKSRKSFYQGAMLVAISTEDEMITLNITPCKNLTAKKGGFVDILNKSRTCSGDPEVLGKTILEAFQDCE